VRCLMAAGAMAGALPVVNSIGVGWTFTMIFFIELSSLLLVVLQLRYGVKKRKMREGQEKVNDEQ
jgi:membrane protein implicated in regulation of membrane protease activity